MVMFIYWSSPSSSLRGLSDSAKVHVAPLRIRYCLKFAGSIRHQLPNLRSVQCTCCAVVNKLNFMGGLVQHLQAVQQRTSCTSAETDLSFLRT